MKEGATKILLLQQKKRERKIHKTLTFESSFFEKNQKKNLFLKKNKKTKFTKKRVSRMASKSRKQVEERFLPYVRTRFSLFFFLCVNECFSSSHTNKK